MDTARIQVPRRTRVLLSLIPVATTVVLVTVLTFFWPWDRLFALLGTAIATFFYMGKFTIVTPVLSDSIPFTPWELALLVTYMDICVALWVVANLHGLYRLPWVGKRLEQLELYGRYTLEQRPIMRKMARIAVTLFVTFPLAGTGAIGAGILGRLLGVRILWIIICISLGALIGCFGMAGLAHILAEPLKEARGEIWFQIAGLAVLAAFVGFFIWRAARINRKLESGELKVGKTDDPATI